MINIVDNEYIDEFDDENDELLNSNTSQNFFFYCGGVLYAIPILNVNEIIEYQHITKVPLMQSYVLGITNIRGSIVGVIDLRDRFDGVSTIIDKKTALVIVNIMHDNIRYNVALLVDEIYEVDGTDDNSITKVPAFGTKVKNTYIASIARYDKKEVYLLNINKILDIDELSLLSSQEDLDDSFYIKNIKKKSKIILSKRFVLDDEYYNEDDDEDEISMEYLIDINQNEINQYLIFEGPNGQYYAKNVSKIEELTTIKDFTIQKNFDDSIVSGTINVRGEMLPLINFEKWLGITDIDEALFQELIIVNIGNHKFGLLIRNTEYIVSIKTDKMTKSSDADAKSTFIANVDLNGQNILCTIVDSDKILLDVFQSEKEKSEVDLDNIDLINFEKTIYFADDSSLIRNNVKSIATKLGVKYQIFENGQLLYDELLQTKIEDIGLIVTDLEMPVLDGKELIKIIRKINNFFIFKIIC